TKNAKRTALIHLLFNIFGTVLMYVILSLVPETVENVIKFFSGSGTDSGTLGRNIAVAHLVFKVFQVIVLYPFMNFIIKLTYLLVPGEDPTDETEEYHVKYIGAHSLPNREVAVPVALKEIERMAQMAQTNLNDAMDALMAKDEEKAKKVYYYEEYIDYLNEEISNYLVTVNQNTLPLKDSKIISALFHVINDIERIGDHAENIADYIPMLLKSGKDFSDESKEELKELMGLVNKILVEALDMFLTGNKTNTEDINAIEDEIDAMEEQLQEAHIKRLQEGKCNAQTGVYFSDLISGLERVGDHAMNIAFAIAEASAVEDKHLAIL
ncbi:MAG: Na/Pi cotransporter family protein, partial [Lachnospiraceae bacterium]|nr:Na/Pi cotransporter family protein [Lachnospiraceae bacterium]